MSDERYRKLFIGRLDPSVEEAELLEYFSQYGEVDDCFVLRNVYTGRHKKCGFIEFHSAAAADAVQAARPHVFRNREVQVKRAVPKEEFARLDGYLTVNKLFIGGIEDHLQGHHLEDYFSQFGTVISVDINRRPGPGSSFALVELNDYDSVDKIMLHGPHTVAGRVLNVRKALSSREVMLLKRGTPVPVNRARVRYVHRRDIQVRARILH